MSAKQVSAVEALLDYGNLTVRRSDCRDEIVFESMDVSCASSRRGSYALCDVDAWTETGVSKVSHVCMMELKCLLL
jgi:hypothetical protein